MTRRIYHDVGRPGAEAAFEARHVFLVEGEDHAACARRVRVFFREYRLVRYARIDVRREASLRGDDPSFARRLEEAVEENRRLIREMTADLRDEGFERLDDLAEMPQGYPSKILHTVTHLVDGFFGIDSAFYSLADDSHFVGEETRRRMEATPKRFHLIEVQASG